MGKEGKLVYGCMSKSDKVHHINSFTSFFGFSFKFNEEKTSERVKTQEERKEKRSSMMINIKISYPQQEVNVNPT